MGFSHTFVKARAPIRLSFNSGNLTKATVSRNGTPAYEISTRRGSIEDTITLKEVNSGRILSVIKHKAFRSDTVMISKLDGGKEIKMRKWIGHTQKHADGHSYASFAIREFDTSQPRTLHWNVIHKDTLVLRDFNVQDPIARLDMPAPGMPQPVLPSLEVDPSFSPHLDEILTSWLEMEHRLRIQETESEIPVLEQVHLPGGLRI